MTPTDADLAGMLASWLPRQRWFAGSAGEVHIAARTELSENSWHVCVAADDEVYQVPVALSPDPAAAIAPYAGGFLVDGLHRHQVVQDLLRRMAPGDDPRAHWLSEPAGCERFRVLHLEQSNTSVVCDGMLVKFLRRLSPGTNPEVEVLTALSGTPEIVPLLGWLEGGWQRPHGGRRTEGCLALFSEYLSDARDGGSLALAAAADDRPFTEEAGQLGGSTARLHTHLAAAFGTVTPIDAVTHLHERLDLAAAKVPEVAAMAPALHEHLDSAQPNGAWQRIHGDLHMGQTLHTARGWRIIDFEGEPASAQGTRNAPDHPLRDVAGMIRSFDYAARYTGERLAWRDGAVDAYLAGYVDAGGFDPHQAPGLLHAYLIDKAAYEAMYERQHRPDWAWLPLAALRELTQ